MPIQMCTLKEIQLIKIVQLTGVAEALCMDKSHRPLEYSYFESDFNLNDITGILVDVMVQVLGRSHGEVLTSVHPSYPSYLAILHLGGLAEELAETWDGDNDVR